MATRAPNQTPCTECGVAHTTERRALVIRRMLPATSEEIRGAWPHLMGDDANTIGRTMRAIGAVRDAVGTWRLR